MLSRKFKLTNHSKLPLQWSGSEFGAVKEEELQAWSDIAVIDVREWMKYAEGHFPGSWNIGLESTGFAAEVGIFVERKTSILLVVESFQQADRARLELLRAGFRSIQGFLEVRNLTHLHRLTQLAVADLKSTLARGGKPALLDVRSSEEWRSSRIPRSINIPLEVLPVRSSELSRTNPLVVICQDGYRSAIGSSWLQSAGFESVHHLIGGMNAYGAAGPTEIFPTLSLSTA
jgi:rhodanese-related sulfurtransferase